MVGLFREFDLAAKADRGMTELGSAAVDAHALKADVVDAALVDSMGQFDLHAVSDNEAEQFASADNPLLSRSLLPLSFILIGCLLVLSRRGFRTSLPWALR